MYNIYAVQICKQTRKISLRITCLPINTMFLKNLINKAVCSYSDDLCCLLKHMVADTN